MTISKLLSVDAKILTFKIKAIINWKIFKLNNRDNLNLEMKKINKKKCKDWKINKFKKAKDN